MAGSKSSNIIFSSVLSYAAATLLLVSALNNVVPKAQAYKEEAAKCLTFLADVPGGKDYCTGFLEPSSSSSSSAPPPSKDWGEDVEQCWSSLKKIEGCVGDIFFALFRGNFDKIGHDCCNAVESLAFECLLEMFPWNPKFPTLLLSFCKNH